MITVFTPSFADESNTNAQNLTVKEVVARLDPARTRFVMLGDQKPDSRIATRPNTTIIPWRKRGNTIRLLFRLIAGAPDVYFFPREGPLDSAFLRARSSLGLKTALVTYVISGGLGDGSGRKTLMRAVREGDVIAANSLHMAKTAERLGGRQVQVVYDGIDRRYYYPPAQPRPPAPHVRVLFAGSFRPYKRVDLVIREAVKHPAAEFRIAGVGEEHDPCCRLANELGARNVMFLGHLDAKSLGEEMRKADVFFFPSEIEGHPQVLGQAGACGLVCVARDLYHPDYVVDGSTGLLAGSDAELGEALEHLLNSAELRAQMSRAAVEHAAKFEWDAIAKQWQEILESAAVQRQKKR